jgi:hypothetical protein
MIYTGILCSLPLIVSGLQTNIHVQLIAAAMILVGGIGVVFAGIMMLLSAAGMANTIVFMQVSENIVFFAARFALFPVESYRLITGIYVPHPGIASVCFLGVCFLSFFNVVIASIKVKKLRQTFTELRTPAGKKKILLQRQSSSTSWLAAGELEMAPTISDKKEK